MAWCSNDPCETDTVTDRNDKPYCHTCAEAYDRGYDEGYSDAEDLAAEEAAGEGI